MELKYKVWDKEQKKFLRIDDEDKGCAKPNYYRNLYFTLNGKIDEDGYPYQIDAEILPYTSLKDKNEKEAYKNDIIHFNHKNMFGDTLEVTSQIEFYQGEFGITINEISQWWSLSKLIGIIGVKFEIIGNAFENPELLEVE